MAQNQIQAAQGGRGFATLDLLCVESLAEIVSDSKTLYSLRAFFRRPWLHIQ